MMHFPMQNGKDFHSYGRVYLFVPEERRLTREVDGLE